MRRWLATVVAAVAWLGSSVPAFGQEEVERMHLPRGVAEEVVAYFNDPSTIRFTGRADIPASRRIEGDVAVLGASVRVGGVIEGSLVVVNGNLVLEDGARVAGDVIVVGGFATTPPGTVGGEITVYEDLLPYRRRGRRIELEEGWGADEGGLSFRPAGARSRISVRVEDSYNRVEGLPVRFGPVFQTAGEDFFRFDALAIWRSDEGLQAGNDVMGWFVRGEQHFGPEGRFSIGGTAHSLVSPIERWGLSDIEASLSTFFLHQDFRDYFERQGFSAYARYRAPGAGVDVSIEYRDEDHGFAPVGSPWTLKKNDAPWRLQPLVGAGRLRSARARVVYDGRNDPADPTDGWYVDASARLGVGGNLTLPEIRRPEPAPASLIGEAVSLGSGFRDGFLDVRRYNRVGPDSDLRLRGVLAGSLDGDPLPPQFQHALGGEGSLPGYPIFFADCGARSRVASIFHERKGDRLRLPVFTGYGCDRVALFQAEYRGGFSVGVDLGPDEDEWDEEWDWYPAIDFTPSWSVFFNAGRGWSLADRQAGDPVLDTGTLVDAGVGIFLGDVGLYWAVPLSGDREGVNFFLRVDHRF